MVRDVMVNGKKIMENRRMLAVDEDTVRAKCREAAKSLWRS
jgi:hypothetical protein